MCLDVVLGFWVSWITRYLTMVGHKLVGMAYAYAGYVGGWLGFVLSVLMRLELGTCGLGVIRRVKDGWLYNSWISAHGVVMLFLFVMPIAIGGFGNYVLPLLLGASELVMPRLNGCSFWLLGVAVCVLLMAQLVFDRPVCCGWTLYPPLSTRDADSVCVSTDLSLLCVHVLGLSSGLGAFNFLATFRHARVTGMTLLGGSLYVWAIAITSFLLVGALPVLGVAITGLLLDRNVCTGVYDGVLGGDPVLYQHLFWFFGHPEVYIVILPVFGAVSLSLSGLVHKEVFGREGMVYCMGAIGIVGFCVWAHHMFCVGLDLDTRAYFSAATAVVSIPTSVKVFSYCSTFLGSTGLRGSSSVWSFWSFLSCFTSGGFTGIMLSSATLDLVLHDTYFVVAHFHTVLSLGAVFGVLMGHLAWTSWWSASVVSEGLALYQVCWLLLGAALVFAPMHTLGLMGMSRRVPEFADVFYPLMSYGSLGLLCLVGSVLWLCRGVYYATSSVVCGTIG